jgi:ribosomal protein L3 glutamine methyltransferase
MIGGVMSDNVTIELTTILDLVRYAATRFNEAALVFGQGTEDAVDDACLLICETLHLPPDRFEGMLSAQVTAAERLKILELVDARVRTRLPVAYLVKRVYMRGLPFYVDQRVIVPRSHIGAILESELFEGGESSLIDGRDSVASVLDLCTGSGCLAILACSNFPNARVDAIDLSEDALQVAQTNVAYHGMQDRITLMKGDLFAPVGAVHYDLILTNPPYVDARGMADLAPECDHEPKLALDGGQDGLDLVRRILAEAGRHLAPGGGLLCEVGKGREVVERAFPKKNLHWIETEECAGEVFWIAATDLI